MKIESTTTTTRKTIITLDAIKGEAAKDTFRREALAFFSGKEDILRVIRYDPYIFCGIDQPLAVRIATPTELGSPHWLEHWSLEDLGIKNSLGLCPSFTAIRIAMDFAKIGNAVPPEYLKCAWHTYMSPINFKMSGDKFISGFGYPDPMFSIEPNLEKYLDVNWVYGGRIPTIYKDQPIVAACK